MNAEPNLFTGIMKDALSKSSIAYDLLHMSLSCWSLISDDDMNIRYKWPNKMNDNDKMRKKGQNNVDARHDVLLTNTL